MSVINKVIGIGVGLLVAAIVVPVALVAIADVNVTTWGTVGTVFSVLLPILAVIALALYFLPKMGK